MREKRRRLKKKTSRIKREDLKKGIYILPNLITTLSLFSGFFSIISSVAGKYEQAAWAIFVGFIKGIQLRDESIKTLSGLVPICAKCKKVRNDQGYWDQIEHFIREHSEAEFSHSLCEDCARELYKDEPWYQDKQKK